MPFLFVLLLPSARGSVYLLCIVLLFLSAMLLPAACFSLYY